MGTPTIPIDHAGCRRDDLCAAVRPQRIIAQENRVVCGAMVVGKPRRTFKRTPRPKTPTIEWRSQPQI